MVPSAMNLKFIAIFPAAFLYFTIGCNRSNEKQPPPPQSAPQPVKAPAASDNGTPPTVEEPGDTSQKRMHSMKSEGSPEPPPSAALPPDMLPVPGGVFKMGLTGKGIPDENPAHPVRVRSFLLDITEVTNGAYAVCVDAGACRRPAYLNTEKSGFEPLEVFRTPDRPVTGVSREDAAAYCKFAGKRLPTEAEWERAARGDDERLFPWGNEMPTPSLAVYRSKVTAPVGSRPKGKGPYGHLDLAGNVWEWVNDRYDPFAYTRETAPSGIPAECPAILAAQNLLRKQGKQGFTGTNPIPTECEFVLRGGAFNYFPFGLRSSNRVHHAGHFRIAMAGFRCADDLPVPQQQAGQRPPG